MRNKGTAIVGSILMVLGVLFLLDNLGIFSINFGFNDIGWLFGNFWPLFLIIPGLVFHFAYFSSRAGDAGLLVPGGILLVIGLTCQVSMLTGWWSYLWPGYILAVAFGLFELYVFGNRDKGLLIPVFILGGLSLIFFSMSLGSIYWLRTFLVPAILIIGGAMIIFKNRR